MKNKTLLLTVLLTLFGCSTDVGTRRSAGATAADSENLTAATRAEQVGSTATDATVAIPAEAAIPPTPPPVAVPEPTPEPTPEPEPEPEPNPIPR